MSQHDDNYPDLLNKYGYVVVKNFIDLPTVNLIKKYLNFTIRRGIWVPHTKKFLESLPNKIATIYEGYADPLLEVLLLECNSFVESVVGEELIPTYSYKRIYTPGEQLLEHIDRPACEISVTCNIDYKGEPNPIFMTYKDYETSVILEPGDAVIYFGCETLHRRPILTKDQNIVQFMLHYVKKNGANVLYAKDKREEYGDPNVKNIN